MSTPAKSLSKKAWLFLSVVSILGLGSLLLGVWTWKIADIPKFVAYLVVALFVAPLAARFFPVAQLFRQTHNELKPDMEFGAVDFQEPSLVWYFRSRVKGWMTPLNSASAPQFMEKDGARFVILPTSAVEKTFSNLPARWKSFSTSGFNIAKGKHVDLTLVLKPD